MRRSILIAVVALLAVASPAAAAHHRHHNKQVVALRHRLHNMTILRNQAKAQVAAEQAQVGALQQQVAELQGTLSQAQQSVSALQSQINSQPSPLTVAINQVGMESKWAEGLAPTVPAGEIISLSAMKYVESHVSDPVAAIIGDNVHTPDGVLAVQAGECGDHATVFAAIMHAFGYTTRRVSFYYTDAIAGPEGHTAMEVYYGDTWHYFDPTYGIYWTDSTGNAMSITDIRANRGTEHKDDQLLMNLIESPMYPSGDDTAFQTDPDTEVVLEEPS